MKTLYQVIPGLWVGGHPSPEEIDGYEITAVLAMCKKQPDPKVATMVEWCLHLPTPDAVKTEFPHERFQVAVGLLDGLLDDSQTVLVNCLQGRNRSMMAAALTGIRRGHFRSGEEALAHCRRLRPNCLWNENFVRELLQIGTWRA